MIDIYSDGDDGGENAGELDDQLQEEDTVRALKLTPEEVELLTVPHAEYNTLPMGLIEVYQKAMEKQRLFMEYQAKEAGNKHPGKRRGDVGRVNMKRTKKTDF